MKEIREKYEKAYPHLKQIKDERTFAINALRLAAPKGVTGLELLKLSEYCQEVKYENIYL